LAAVPVHAQTTTAAAGKAAVVVRSGVDDHRSPERDGPPL